MRKKSENKKADAVANSETVHIDTEVAGTLCGVDSTKRAVWFASLNRVTCKNCLVIFDKMMKEKLSEVKSA
jgi:hypothetical protein